MKIIDLSPRARPDGDPIGDVAEMVPGRASSLFAGQPRLFDHRQKIAVFPIVKDRREFAGAPVFRAVIVNPT